MVVRLQKSGWLGRVVCVVCACLLLFSFVFVILEWQHDCAGADCPVCAGIRTLLQGDDACIPGAIVFAAAMLLTPGCRRILSRRKDVRTTPVRDRIRMNN